jgi:hypothetical protein
VRKPAGNLTRGFGYPFVRVHTDPGYNSECSGTRAGTRGFLEFLTKYPTIKRSVYYSNLGAVYSLEIYINQEMVNRHSEAYLVRTLDLVSPAAI